MSNIEKLLCPREERRALLRSRLREAKRELNPYLTWFTKPLSVKGGGKIMIEVPLTKEQYDQFHSGNMPRKFADDLFNKSIFADLLKKKGA